MNPLKAHLEERSVVLSDNLLAILVKLGTDFQLLSDPAGDTCIGSMEIICFDYGHNTSFTS